MPKRKAPSGCAGRKRARQEKKIEDYFEKEQLVLARKAETAVVSCGAPRMCVECDKSLEASWEDAMVCDECMHGYHSSCLSRADREVTVLTPAPTEVSVCVSRV